MKIEKIVVVLGLIFISSLILLANLSQNLFTGKVVQETTTAMIGAAGGNKDVCEILARTYQGNLEVLPEIVRRNCGFNLNSQEIRGLLLLQLPSFSTEQLNSQLSNTQLALNEVNSVNKEINSYILPPLNTRISNLQAQVIPLNSEISKLNTDISSISRQLSEKTASLSNLQSTNTPTQQTICKKISFINRCSTSFIYQNNDKIKKVSGEIEQIKSSEISLKNSLNQKTKNLNLKTEELNKVKKELELMQEVGQNAEKKKNELTNLNTQILENIRQKTSREVRESRHIIVIQGDLRPSQQAPLGWKHNEVNGYLPATYWVPPDWRHNGVENSYAQPSNWVPPGWIHSSERSDKSLFEPTGRLPPLRKIPAPRWKHSSEISYGEGLLRLEPTSLITFSGTIIPPDWIHSDTVDPYGIFSSSLWKPPKPPEPPKIPPPPIPIEP